MVLIEPGAARPPTKRPLEDPASNGGNVAKVVQTEPSKQARTAATAVPHPLGLVPGIAGPAILAPGIPNMANLMLSSFSITSQLSASSVEQLATVAAISDLQAASMPQQEEQEKKPEPEAPAAFDKDALMRLAREAQEKGVSATLSFQNSAALTAATSALQALQGFTAPPPPPPPEDAPMIEVTPVVEEVEPPPKAPAPAPQVACAEGPRAAPQIVEAAVAPPPVVAYECPQPLPAADATFATPLVETLPALPAKEEVVVEKLKPPRFVVPEKIDATSAPKKDAKALTSILQQVHMRVQNNVARGTATETRRPEQASLHHAFAIGGPSGGSSAAEVSKQYEALLERFDGSAAVIESRPALEKEVLRLLPKLEPRSAAELLARTQAEDGMRTSHLLQEITTALGPYTAKLGSQNLIRMMVTLAAWVSAVCLIDDTKVRPPESTRNFFASAAKDLSTRLMDIASVDLCRIATSLGSAGYMEAHFFSSLAKAAAQRGERMALQDLVVLVEALEKAGFWHTGLLEAVAKGLQDKSGEDLPWLYTVKAMRTLAACCIRDPGLADVLGKRLLAAAAPLGFEERCSLAWSASVLDLYHEGLFKPVFGLQQDASVEDSLSRLYETHLALQAFSGESYKSFSLQDEAVEGLLDHYRKQRMLATRKGTQQRLERSSEKVHEDVAVVLREVSDASVHRQYQTVHGLTVDMVAMDRRGSSMVVVVEIDGPATLLTSLDVSDDLRRNTRVRGSVLLKRRLLQRQGLKMAVLSEELWNSLGDSREKRELLRELLKAAGVPKERVH